MIGVVRAEKLDEPEQYIEAIIERVGEKNLTKVYDVQGWTNSEEFLTLLANRFGRLKKGGEPNLNEVSKIILNDFQRGKIPYFSTPPSLQSEQDQKKSIPNKAISNSETQKSSNNSP